MPVGRSPITIRVAIPDEWDAGTKVQAYADGGTGTVDLTRPLLSRAMEVFPGAFKAQGHAEQPFAEGEFGTGLPDRPETGLEDTESGETPWCEPEPEIEIPIRIEPAFGKWKFAVKAVDEEGHVQGAAALEIEQIVSALDPDPVGSMRFDAYDPPSDRIRFAFTLKTV